VVLWLIRGARFWGRDGRAHRAEQPTRSAARKRPFGPCETIALQKESAPVRLQRVDYWLMLGLTVFYALFGFYHLGSRAVPESGWYVETAGESLVLDMGETQDVRQIYVYTGWIDRRKSDQEVCRNVQVACSADGESWTDADAPMVLDTVFKWHVFRGLPQACRYIRLTCDDGRFYVNEIALFGETEADRFAVTAVQSANPTAGRVIDEPDRVTYAFSWYETTYFDEIYHPRTAYEFITHRYPYENTHPPLGKVIIACGMLLFGVNPFGWRFFGTLCGVLMVPLVYVMGKKMLKETRYAFMAAFVFSFDFMHLAQTRLATIDSYTAFFVMGMYLFMFLYIEKSFYTAGVGKTLPPLLASGICFGLGAATKWQGIYAGAGLAVLFFYSLFRRFSEYRAAKAHPEQPDADRIIKAFRPMAVQTVLAGFLFFVAVPAVIYFLSYIPAMMSESTGLSFFFTNQGSMLNYHAHLDAPHSYGSSWWQWPFDYKPLYAYGPNRDFVPAGRSMGITSFGNPAVWWLTIPVVIWGVYQICRRRRQVDLGLLTAVVGFFSLYAPWIFVTRTAFIYHFFPCVVFVVLLLMFFFREKGKDLRWRRLEWLYMAVVLVLFLAFYPVLTGMEIPSWYAGVLRWVPGWVLG
ncbi:MAG: phospholipid carrier-dependent glycosyltransferase, partial [Clostridia bacterium]